MTSCARPGCGGSVEETGFCDTCGRRPPEPASAESAGAERSRPSSAVLAPGEAAGSGSGRSRGESRWVVADLVSLPVLEFADPASRVRGHPPPPEDGRTCGVRGCSAKVGAAYGGQPALAEGFCPDCGEPFSFVPKLRPGDLVGDQYEVIGCLDSGGLGWVYLARDTHLDGNLVALKGLINTHDGDALRLAVAERRFLTMLDHPNVVRIFNFVTHPDPQSGEQIGYTVMEYVGGQSLHEVKERARAEGGLLAEHVAAYGHEILAALQYLHDRELLYCDMKPHNVIRGPNRLKVIDLGAVRRFGDRTSPIVGTEPYQVPLREIRERGLTVSSDIHTVGRTLGALLHATDDWVAGQSGGPRAPRFAFGLRSFRRVLDRATDSDPDRRFGSAAEMAAQLRAVVRELGSLKDGRERPEPSQVFAQVTALLDGGLGVVPPLRHWTAGGHAGVLWDGRPTAEEVATRLPPPLVDQADPAANFLATAGAPDPQRLLATLATFDGPASVEVEFSACRAQLAMAEPVRAGERLVRAAELLSPSPQEPSPQEPAEQAADVARLLEAAARRDWRMAWHRGLLALAGEDPARSVAGERPTTGPTTEPTASRATRARACFEEVYSAVPGEDAPKLALGYCAELLGEPAEAGRLYEAVWLRDHAQAGAAFGLARIALGRGDRAEAVAALDGVSEKSPHRDVAMIAAVRVLFGRIAVDPPRGTGLPTAADLRAAVTRLPDLYLDGRYGDSPARDRLVTALREATLEWVETDAGGEPLDGGDVLGSPVTGRGLRGLVEESLRRIAYQARDADDHGVLVDRANRVRPRTWR
ncbi:protein kinase [Solihabitans fulvus]|uniref:non-specific serine/threonine protein kinase n=1 Tax=Solihabitans fulvus TaxID=1892852 RepID=A0A5B2WTN4_9PSEU|nr:serine/threonine-protein kinase [Solihabitans fulvus]KAA2253896.1 protein kinase [Solihabitans fulvus]